MFEFYHNSSMMMSMAKNKNTNIKYGNTNIKLNLLDHLNIWHANILSSPSSIATKIVSMFLLVLICTVEVLRQKTKLCEQNASLDLSCKATFLKFVTKLTKER